MARAMINGADLFYEESGSGQPLLFHHGYNGSHDSWEGTVERLRGKYRCIVMDCRGAGDSEHTAGGYTIAQYADDAVGLMDHLGIGRFTFIGHSMGGITGMQMALSHGARLERLVLVAPAPADGVGNAKDPAGNPAEKHHLESRALRAARASDELVRQNVVVNPRGRTEADVARSVERTLSVSDLHFENSWRELVEFNQGDRLRDIQTPTLVVAGATDSLLPANLKDFQRLPNATLHVFSRVGHGVPTDVPIEFAEVLDDFFTHGVLNAQTQAAKLAAAAGVG